MNAVTDRELVGSDREVEPRTNYFVARLNWDLRGRNSGIGAISESDVSRMKRTY